MPDIESEGWNEGEQSSSPTDERPPEETEQAEIQEVQVDDQEITEKMDQAEVFGTCTKRIGPYKVQIGPTFSNEGIYWELSITKKGVTGPMYREQEPIPDAEAGWLGIEPDVQEAANEALEFANQHMIPSRMHRGQERPHRSLSELVRFKEDHAE